MRIVFLCGGSRQRLGEDMLAHFTERLAHYDQVEVRILDTRESDAARAQKDISAKMLEAIGGNTCVLFDERGKAYTSEAYAVLLERLEQEGKTVFVCIGGAYGVDDTLRARADHLISLGLMILPHELARIMAIEQTYRARSITKGSGYHHA